MNTFERLRAGAAVAAGVTAVMVMHCGSAFAQSEIGPEELAATQAAQGQPSYGLPKSAVDAAASYHFYMRSAGGMSAAFTDGAAVARSVRLGASYEPKSMARGAVAYAAVVALQDPAFVDGVRSAAGSPEQRQALVAALVNEPYRSSVLPGARRAAGRIAAQMGGEGVRVRDTGLRVKQAAYDVQRQAWSKGEVSGRVERLAEVKTLSLSSLEAPQEALFQTVSAEVQPASARRTSVIDRGLALAALAALGAADTESVEPLLNDAECSSCLRMAKLNLFQCLAVAKPWYEDVFCLGQHVLIDTGDCIYTSSGASRDPKPSLQIARPGRREDEEDAATVIALN